MDRKSFRQQEVTVKNVTVIITEYAVKPPKKSPSLEGSDSGNLGSPHYIDTKTESPPESNSERSS